VSPRTRNALVVAAVLLVALAFAWDEGLLRPAPAPLRPTPEALALGERILASRCLHCHSAIPLAPRVAGWSAERAYEALGRLPQLYPAMPPFHGTDDERRALAMYLATLGAAGPRRP
jgi:mono/diheme cytochrome c family protein